MDLRDKYFKNLFVIKLYLGDLLVGRLFIWFFISAEVIGFIGNAIGWGLLTKLYN